MNRLQLFSSIIDQDEEGEGLSEDEDIAETGESDEGLEKESSPDDEEI